MAVFKIQIVDTAGEVVELPGAGGRLERDLIGACTDAIVSRGVGLFRTEATVRQAIEEGITEVIRDLKHETKSVVR